MNPTSGVRQQYTDPAALVHLNIQGFTFGHIYYTLLNTPEVQASNYTEGGTSKPTYLLHFGTHGSIGWVSISADGNTIETAPDQLALGNPTQLLVGDLLSQLNEGIANIFYIFTKTTVDPSLTPDYPTALVTAPGDSTGESGGTTGDASSPGDSTGGTTDGSTDTVVTATGAACSIVPKNFNLF